jgi:exopolysaccharide biosynthesis polyprenyl glycosylphosphotransferase
MFEVELRKEKALFAATDVFAIFVAVVAAGFLNDARHTPPCVLCPATRLHLLLVVLALTSLWLVSGRAMGLYELRPGSWQHLFCVFKTSILATVVALTVSFMLHGEPPRLLAALVLLFSVNLILAARGSVSWFLQRFRGHPSFATPIVIVGFNNFGFYLADQLDHSFKQYQIIGFLDLEMKVGAHAGHPVIGDLSDLRRLAQTRENLEVVIALPDSPAELTDEIVALCEQNNLTWRVVPTLVRSLASGLQVDNVGVVPLVGARSSRIQGLNFVLKRSTDIAVTLVALLVSSPIMVIAALAIMLFDGRPVLFRQTRVGLYGKPFQLLKFRTMRQGDSDRSHQAYVREWIRDNAPASSKNGTGKVYKMTADSRITRVGRILRRFSIDELPQLINVLRGEMSLIGPRPALSYELDLYQDWHRSRLAALPGITGLWQVSGRNSLSFEDMVRLDIRYIEDWSLAEDIRIMVRTIPALFNGGGH